jgi:hypothetical protein
MRGAALFAFTAACSLLTTVDDLGGHDGGGSVDGGDVDTVKDVGPIDVVSIDAGDGGDASAGPFCATLDASNVLFCDDFDEADGAFFPNWASNGVAPTRDTQHVRSAPYAVRVSLPPVDGGGGSSGYILRNIAATNTHVVVSYDAYVGLLDATNQPIKINQLYAISTSPAFTNYLVSISQTATRFVVSASPDGGGAVQSTYAFSSTWPAGTWHHVVMDLQLALNPVVATVTVDGKVEVANVAAPVATLGPPTSVQLRAGIFSILNATSTVEANVDNVVVQTPP